METIWRLNEHLAAGAALRLRVGDVLQYAGYVHGSVGNTIDFEIVQTGENLRYLNGLVEFHTPENMREGWTGGDGATMTMYFRAMQAGEATLRVLHYFRGEVEQVHEWLISIEEGQ